MGSAQNRMYLVEKLFEQGLKRKLSQLSREYDPKLVFEVWAQITKTNGGRDYFGGWKWMPDMTLEETLTSLDEYLNGLNAVLEKNPGYNTEGDKKCT